MTLTPEQLQALCPQWRFHEDPVLGQIMVRTPSHRDVENAVRLDRPDWWLEACVADKDGHALFPPGACDYMSLDGALVGRLQTAVFTHPTLPPAQGGQQPTI